MTATRTLVIGAGGHARVCLEALCDDPARSIIGAVSLDGTGVTTLGVPMLGRQDSLAAVCHENVIDSVFVAIGDNDARRRVTEMCTELGLALVVALSRFAMISRTATIARGSAILPGAVVNAATTIGEGAIVNTNCSIDHDGRIGEYAHVAPGATLGGEVTVGALALIGTGARILPGVTIGEACVVGAGAVVLRDVPDGQTVVGVPAAPLSPAVDDMSRLADVLRRVVDIAAAVAGLTLLSPVIAATMVAVRVRMGRSVLFRQRRLGLGGRPFEVIKLRTMLHAKPGREGPEFDAERLLPLGKWLRATSLDELPSLVNLLRGDITLVGPRPLPVQYWPRYRGAEYRRFEVKPGITGLAQVNGRNTVDWPERLALDVQYVETRSLVGDAKILFKTVPAVLGRHGIEETEGTTMTELPVDR